MTVHIGQRTISSAHKPYIIAEIGVNHDGQLDRAISLIDAAVAANADAVKFQYFEADALLSRAAVLAAYQQSAGATDPRTMLRTLELSLDNLEQCVDYAHEHGIHSIVTSFSVQHVAHLAHLSWDAYKTASPDIINQPLIEELIQHGKGQPLILSTGAADLEEVATAITWIGEHPHLVMQCVSSYPTALQDAALAGRFALESVTRYALGYSDHTQDVITGALAVATGATLLEKHLTWNREAAGPDHAASLDPVQLAEYVRLAHETWQALGPKCKQRLECEVDVRQVSRQSIVATRELPAGHVVRRSDVTIKRPGTGMPPSMLESIIGCTLASDIEADMPLHSDAVVMDTPHHVGAAVS